MSNTPHMPHIASDIAFTPAVKALQERKGSRMITLAKRHRVVPMGFFDGNPGEHDARLARRVLLLFAKLGMPDLVVLVHDADDRPDRRDGFEQARRSTPIPERIVIGIANPEREVLGT